MLMHIYRWLHNQRVELYLGLFTWVLVFVIGTSLWVGGDSDVTARLTPYSFTLSVVLYLLFIAGYMVSYGTYQSNPSEKTRLAGIALSSVSALSLSIFFFFGLVGILVTIIVAQLPFFLRVRQACIVAVLFPFVATLLDVWTTSLPFRYENLALYVIFNLLVVLAAHRHIAERAAKKRSEQLVHQLRATQILLSAATKREERMRIARDLHDASGHQLTALSLQLEAASHSKGDAVQEHILRARAITGLLLSEVREAVSELRKKRDLDLFDALKRLVQNVPGLTVDLSLTVDESLVDARQAEVVFRCVQEAITNTIKHTSANFCSIALSVDEQDLVLSVKDNGVSRHEAKPGDGLIGMAERVEKIDGHLDYRNNADGFLLTARLPMAVGA